MKFAEWSMQGLEFANCNCIWGCPCQFNGAPTHGNCRAYTFVQIEKGHFNDVPLDGLRWGILAAWPGPIHLGNGTFQSIVDSKADAGQRAAIEAVSHGRETDPGTLIWQVFSATITKLLPTIYKPIELAVDMKARTAKVSVPGLLDGSAETIRNPMTKAAHQIRVTLPTGFEFTESEFVSGSGKSPGQIEIDFDGTHAHLAHIHWTTHGVIH